MNLGEGYNIIDVWVGESAVNVNLGIAEMVVNVFLITTSYVVSE